MSTRAPTWKRKQAAEPEKGEYGLSAAEVKEFRELFNLLDKDGGGSISKDELAELMSTLGIKATPEEVEMMVREVDEDGSGEIDFGEFCRVMGRRVDVPYTSSEVKAAFKALAGQDAPADHVKATDLVGVMQAYAGEALPPEKLKELLSQLEPDANGYVNYAEYVNMMMDS